MNIIKNILRKFENHEQANLTIEYCSIDQDYLVVLTENGLRHGFVDKDLDNINARLVELVIELKGSI